MESTEAVRRWCVLTHAAALLGLVLPLGQLLGPYLVWLLAPRGVEELRRQAEEALNFQLALAACFAVLLAALLWLHAGFALFLVVLPNLVAFGGALWAAARASAGRRVHYPIPVRVIRLGSGAR